MGAATQKVTVTDEEGQTIERVIPKTEFLKRLGIFYFDNESGDPDLDWLQHGLAWLIDFDLARDTYFTTETGFSEAMQEAGFAQGVGAPLTLKRRLASQGHHTYFLAGSFKHEGETLTFSTKLYKSKNAKLVAEHTFSSSDVFELVDSVSLQLKRDLDIPEYHLEEITDLPVADMMTNSRPALELYFRGTYEMGFENDYKEAARYMEEAVKLDATFAYAHYQLYTVYLRLGLRGEGARVIASAMQHKYKLPERYRFFAQKWAVAALI